MKNVYDWDGEVSNNYIGYHNDDFLVRADLSKDQAVPFKFIKYKDFDDTYILSSTRPSAKKWLSFSWDRNWIYVRYDK